MFNIVLYQPEIAPNTGNIIRLCANTGAKLHLIHPLGFTLDDRKLKRAGLDYHDATTIKEYADINSCLENQNPERIFAISTRGKSVYTDIKFKSEDMFLFGPETRGLPVEFLNSLPAFQTLRIPMKYKSRSLNLSNTVAILYIRGFQAN